MIPNSNAYVKQKDKTPNSLKSFQKQKLAEELVPKSKLSIDEQIEEFAKIIVTIYFETIEMNENK